MPINTEPSTFEFTQYWLVASECFVRDCMLRTEGVMAEARAAALELIHREEILSEEDEDKAGGESPNPPPSVNPVPRALIEKITDRRELAGTGTWRGSGTVHVSIWTEIREEHRLKRTDSPAVRKEKFTAFRVWCDQLVNTLRSELMAESGRSDEEGNPYLHATSIDIEVKPMDQEPEESGPFVGFTLSAEWR